MGCRTLHPLVSVINLSEATPVQPPCLNMACYVICLKEDSEHLACYGRKSYDYQDGVLACFTPAHFMNPEKRNCIYRSKGYLLILHADLVQCTSLGANLPKYTFLSYRSDEALHLSLREKTLILECIHHIDRELQHCVDKFSSELIAKYVGLLLDYCARFYERQFETRNKVNNDIIVRFEHLLNEYFEGDAPQHLGLPSVKYFADKVFLSPNYFGDMIRKQTGKTVSEYIQDKMIELAKEQLLSSDKTTSQIAYEIGFQYPQHLSRMFKRIVGMTPNKFRTQT